MNVSFVVTCHHGKLRKNGMYLFRKYLKSVRGSVRCNYRIFAVDNGSESPMRIENYDVKVLRIEDQSKFGITGAWNIGVREASKFGDIIVNTNDDVEFTDSINTLFEIIIKIQDSDNILFGPVTNKEGVPTPLQRRENVGDLILDITNISHLNGFAMAFTKKFYDKHNIDSNLYSIEDRYKISYQEGELQDRLWKEGVKSYLVEPWYVYHDKQRGWMQL